MREIFDSEQTVHIVMEYLEDGELSQLIDNEFFDEKESTQLIYQTLSAIKHLNKCGIAHCDLKP